MIDASPVTVFFVLCTLLFGYFLPWIIAAFRDHHQRSAILLLNLFLGWTILGWVAAIVWSATAIPVKETPHA
jgi:ABC-type sugar transport system permease subunit